MGQYFRAINIDTKEIVSPYDYENGAKLAEHSWIGNRYLGAVECMLTPNGKWYRKRLVWSGDYADDGKFVPDGYDKSETLYSIACEHFAKLKPRKFRLPKEYRYIVNYSKDEYIDRSILPNSNGWRVNPLSILTCDGNGRGGGDYHCRNDIDAKYVGSWAGDEIGIEIERPSSEFNEIRPDFFEDMS